MNEVIKFCPPTNIIQVELPDGRFIEGPRGSTIEDLLQLIKDESPYPLMGCIVNSEIRELTYVLQRDAKIQPIYITDPDGWVIYRRSLVFMMSAAFEKLFPKYDMLADHSISSGGVYCHVPAMFQFGEKEMRMLEDEMHRLSEENQPIIREEISLDDARSIFRKKQQGEKVRLLNYRNKDYLTIYRLGNFQDYHYGYMVPSTAYLRNFAIESAGNQNGFYLRFPREGKDEQITPLGETPQMLREFKEYGKRLAKLGIDNIASLNEAIETNRIPEVILVSEALHDQAFAQIAENIVNHDSKVHIVLIAGPSSSGKTTSSKRLSIELLAHGISPIPIEMDNFFVDRELTPKDAEGNYDFESVNALDIPLMDKCLADLISGKEVEFPRYDFKLGKSVPGKVMKLEKDQILILEGIHGLNPKLLVNLDARQMYRIYISPMTQLNFDRYNRVSAVDTRLVRRIVRDFRERGYSAQDTISRWASVRAGEIRNITPYQGLADDLINTSLVYELAALKAPAELALRLVPFGTEEHVEAKRLLSFLDWVLPLETDVIPGNSILREFIGDSYLKDFTVWRKH